MLAAGADGRAAFKTVFPGCYPGRWPHVHFEVYESVAAAARGVRPLVTSQIALPKETCDVVYADPLYRGSARHLASLSLATDGVFRDGVDRQLATISGTGATGYVATLAVALRT